MKKRKTAMLLAACLCVSALTGCGGQEQKIYEQAGRDLEQGSYEYALKGYETSAANGVRLPHSYRGMGISQLRMGQYKAAAESFTSALNCEKLGKSLKRDLLAYRATAYLKAGAYAEAMADCQAVSEECGMDADMYFLTGKVALAMDSYEEAASNLNKAYEEDPTYDMAIRIYEVYISRDMEADGTGYLERALESEPKDAQDYCDRGRIYYYMDDYKNAGESLIEASNQGNTEAFLLLGMVYMAQKDTANARAMYNDYISRSEKAARGYNGLALCDISEGKYEEALTNIETGISMAEADEMQSLLFNEIVVREKMLDFETAKQKAKEYLEMYPEDRAAAKELAFLKTRTRTQE